MIDVVWRSYNPDAPSRGYWDMAMLEDLLSGAQYTHHDNPEKWPSDGAIVVIPARSHYEKVNDINQDIAKLKWCLLILVGDEEALFPLKEIKHDNIKTWVMLPRLGTYDKADMYIPNGYTPDTRPLLSKHSGEKDLDWFFAGQVTHKRRKDCIDVLKRIKGGRLVETEGFTQGLEHEEYYSELARTKIAPCPSGPETVDTFRMYEALEAGCIPVADTKTPKENEDYFWSMLYGDHPITTVNEWEYLPGHIESLLENYQKKANGVFSWWLNYKRQVKRILKLHLEELGCVPDDTLKEKITVVIPTSPIPSAPDTKFIDEVVKSIRYHLPEVDILIMVDGIRDEQKKYEDKYNEYIRRILWKCNFEWGNTTAIIFDEHHHQAAMTLKTLEHVHTPMVFFAEHDTPLTTDYDIPFRDMVKTIENGDANLVRLHFEAQILDVHNHLMLGAIDSEGHHYERTIQWSQRPHLTSKIFYNRILTAHFSPDSRTMIEDVMHGVVIEAYKAYGMPGWNDYRLIIYNPPGNIKRSYHTDGRENDEKYDDRYIK